MSVIRREEKSVNRRGEKPVYQPFGKGVEAAGLSRDIHDGMKLENRRKNSKKAARGKKGQSQIKAASNDGWLSRGTLLRILLTLVLFGGALHGLFVAFGIYDRNQSLSNGDQFVLLIKLLVFVTLMHLFYLMLMHYRPIRQKVRGLFFMALAPVAAICIFMIYGGAGMFGSFLPILQFLTLTIGVGGFILYVATYTWLSGRIVRRRGGFDTHDDDGTGSGGDNAPGDNAGLSARHGGRSLPTGKTGYDGTKRLNHSSQ